MIKRIYSYTAMLLGALAVTVSCSEDDSDKITHFSSLVDVSSSSVSADKYNMVTVFSTDGGTTFVDFPKVSKGQQYLVKVVNNASETDATSENCFILDWSGSNPQPSSVDNNGVATFTMSSTNDILAKVTNVPFVAADVAGSYEVVTDDWEDFAEGDVLTVQAIDATHIEILEYPATSTAHAPLVITIPDPSLGGAAVVESQFSGQYTASGYKTTTSGKGLVNCNGTISLTLDFKLTNPSGTYTGNVLELKKK